MSTNQGSIVQCIGAVVDIEFPRSAMPKVYDALTLDASATHSGVEAGLTFEVQQQLGDGVVRTIALGSSDGLRRGMAVNNTGATAAASSILDVSSTDKGILIPRVSLSATTDAATIVSPATSLIVYNTNAAIGGGQGIGVYYNAGTTAAPVWTKFAGVADNWYKTGNTGTSAATNFIGTTDAVDLVFRTNNNEKMRLLPNGNLGIGNKTGGKRANQNAGQQIADHRNGQAEQGDAGGQAFRRHSDSSPRLCWAENRLLCSKLSAQHQKPCALHSPTVLPRSEREERREENRLL